MKQEPGINISYDLDSYQVNDTIALEEMKRIRVFDSIAKVREQAMHSSINDFPKPMIDEIKNDEYVTLFYSLGMCVHGTLTKCVFKKVDSKVYGIFGGKFVLELDEGQIEKVRRLELDLFEVNKFQSMWQDDCSNSDKEYAFYLKQKKRVYHYDTCDDRNLLKLLIDDIVTNGKHIKY